jgi:hypothetical protein
MVLISKRLKYYTLISICPEIEVLSFDISSFFDTCQCFFNIEGFGQAPSLSWVAANMLACNSLGSSRLLIMIVRIYVEPGLSNAGLISCTHHITLPSIMHAGLQAM